MGYFICYTYSFFHL
jgi:organic hydroperoxide reductase OsmC/OhrA